MVRKHDEQSTVRRYLLKKLSAAEQKALELQLLTDDALSEELEIVEDELIDEYLDDELSADERRSFLETFLAHSERKRKLQEGQALKRYLGTLPSPSPAPRKFEFLKNWIQKPVHSPIGAFACVLLVAVAGYVIWSAYSSRSDLKKGLLALNQAYRQQRPVEARLSNIDYAPYIATRNNEPIPVNTLERDSAQLFLTEAVKGDADAESYHALGKFYLLERNIDQAIEHLERARQSDPRNAQIYADLGAAYLEKGKQELDPSGRSSGKATEHLGQSLDYLKQAIELDPNLLEALFNRGLVHEYQELFYEAEANWRAYLEKDPNSAWSVEARERLKSVESKKALVMQEEGDPVETFLTAYNARDDDAAWESYKRSHTAAGNRITSALVGDFLAENARRNRAENMQALNYLGQLELRKVKDAYTSDLARVYSLATPQTKALLVQAREQMTNGFKLSRGSEFGSAMQLFLRARTNFEKSGNVPESLLADAAIAHAAVLQPDLEKAREVLTRIIPLCEANNYKWMVAQNLSDQAHLNSNLNNYSEAISDSNRSLQLLQELEDMKSVSAVFVQLASLHLFLNDTQMSFSYLRRALATARMQRAPLSDLWSIHTATSLTLTAIRLYRAAFDYQNEALQLALAFNPSSPLLISRSYQNLGRTYGSLRQFEPALQNVRLAYEQGQSTNDANGQSMMAYASLTLGDLYRAAGDPANALAAYEESSRRYEALKFAHYSYAAHKGKFLCYLALNDDNMAQQELQIVLNLFDNYREKILGTRQQNFFFDREQDTYDLAIDFTYSRLKDEHRAFDYSESSRARNLRELMHHGAEITESDSGMDLRAPLQTTSQRVLPPTITEIYKEVPEPVQIVQYSLLEKKLLIWHVTRRRGVWSTSVDIESTKLGETVVTALRHIARRDEQGSATGLKTLYKLIIEPIRDQLDPQLVLCFIPDKILHYVPFGALMSEQSGRYLVQDYRLMTSPSTTILIDLTNEAIARNAFKAERLLAVGNPAFDRAANPNLKNLSSAAGEVQQIARDYLPRRILVGKQATRNSIIDELSRSTVAHFAAHYEVDPRSTLSSELVLASDAAEPANHQRSGLSAGDIYEMNLALTRLVVLAGCKTGIEQQFGGEGPVGFARSFLVAGVPVVVASLWPVDSDATSQLMIAFHRFRKFERLPTAQALMRAQNEIMAREHYRHPYYWAGFTVIGGNADY